MKRISIFLSLIMALNLAFGQVKYERERRLKSSDVPRKALNFIGVDLEIKQLKWYREESLEGISIEAKFKIDNKKYSVEFDTLGQLEDVEIEVNKVELPESTLKQINSILSDNYKRFKVLKIQEQLKGDIEKLDFIFSLDKKVYCSGYEFVIKGFSSDGLSLYECFFDINGELISSKKIVLNSTEHLEY